MWPNWKKHVIGEGFGVSKAQARPIVSLFLLPSDQMKNSQLLLQYHVYLNAAMILTFETVSQTPIKCFLFIKDVMAMVSLHSNRIPTKTTTTL